jgi:hypothetical protein
MNTILIQAITDLKMVELRYQGYSRVVEPHAYGRDKNNDEIIRCFQTSGGSKSGENAGWKLLKVRDVYSSHLTNATFQARNDYKRKDSAMTYIFTRI